MNNYEVCVVLITYNHILYIEQAIESVLNQKTNFEYEIIIHDDCSTDGTAHIVEHYAKQYNNITAIIEKHNCKSKGIVFSYNLYKKTNAKYIAFLECDDYWCDEYKLQKQYDFLNSHQEYSFVGHLTRGIDKKGNNIKCFVDEVLPGEYSIRPTMEWRMFSHTSAWFFRNIFSNPENDSIFNYYFSLHNCPGDRRFYFLMRYFGRIYVLGEYMSVYRFQSHESSFTSKNFGKNTSFLKLYMEVDEAESLARFLGFNTEFPNRKKDLYDLCFIAMVKNKKHYSFQFKEIQSKYGNKGLLYKTKLVIYRIMSKLIH